MNAQTGGPPVNLIETDARACKEALEGGALVLVDFWASWCGPCRALQPVLEELAGRHPTLLVAKVDIEANETLADEMEVRSVPTLLLFKAGACVERLVGRVPYPLLARAVARHS